MNYENMLVLLFGQNETLKKDLMQSGIQVMQFPDSDYANHMRHALSESDACYFLTVRTHDDFSQMDILAIANALRKDSSKLYVGERTSSDKGSLAQKIYCFLSGIETSDVTSSLYGISRENLELIACLKSKDKGFFQNIPLLARTKGVKLEAICSSTILKEAPSLRVLTNTAKLYMVFIKFSIAAFIAYLVDIGTFYLFQKLFSGLDDEFKILYSTILSRILCSIATYLLNRGAVFQSQAKSTGTVIRFLILAAGQLVASWLLVWGIGSLMGGGDATNTLLKIIIDLIIFIASFSIQRDWVFKESKGLLK